MLRKLGWETSSWHHQRSRCNKVEGDPSMGIQKCNKYEIVVKNGEKQKESKLCKCGPMRLRFRLWVETFKIQPIPRVGEGSSFRVC